MLVVEHYRVEMTQKAGVEACSPPLDAPFSLYPPTSEFRRAFVYKLVNAQLAAMRSLFLLRKIFEPSKRALLEELVKRFGPPEKPGIVKRLGSLYHFFDDGTSATGGDSSPRSPRLGRRSSLRNSLKRAISRPRRTSNADENGAASDAAAAVAAVAAAAAVEHQTSPESPLSAVQATSNEMLDKSPRSPRSPRVRRNLLGASLARAFSGRSKASSGLAKTAVVPAIVTPPTTTDADNDNENNQSDSNQASTQEATQMAANNQ